MKIKDLANYCKSINIDCYVCEHQMACKRMASHLEDQSPYGVVKMVKEDMEFED